MVHPTDAQTPPANDPRLEEGVIPISTMERWDKAREAVIVAQMAERAHRDRLLKERARITWRLPEEEEIYIGRYLLARSDLEKALADERACCDRFTFELDQELDARYQSDSDDGKPTPEVLFGNGSREL